MTDPIFIIYHVALLGTWEMVLREQLYLLHKSGLGVACRQLIVHLCGVTDEYEVDRVKTHFKAYHFYPKTIFTISEHCQLYEFPAIELVRQTAAAQPHSKILYFHTKGVTHSLVHHIVNGQKYFKYTPQQVENLSQWRKFMAYFLIENWQDCVEKLQTYDICGTDWVKPVYQETRFYAGNFWWANASYITRCTLKHRHRYDAEYFIGTGNPNAYELMSSIKNPMLRHYLTESEIELRSSRKNLDPTTPYFRWADFFYDPKYYRKD